MSSENDVRFSKYAAKSLPLMKLQRVRLGISQKRLGQMTGISCVTIQALESGNQPQIGLSSASKIAEVLQLRPDELLTDLRDAEIHVLEPA